MNELLEKYIEETFNDNWDIDILSSYIVLLTDLHGNQMSLMNLGNDIFVYIDNELYETVSYKYNHLTRRYEWIIRR